MNYKHEIEFSLHPELYEIYVDGEKLNIRSLLFSSNIKNEDDEVLEQKKTIIIHTKKKKNKDILDEGNQQRIKNEEIKDLYIKHVKLLAPLKCKFCGKEYDYNEKK